MERVTIKGYVHCRPGYDGKPEYGFYSTDMSHVDGFGICIGPVQFEYAVPAEFNAVAAQVSALEKQRDAISKEFADKVRKLNERIAKLLAIEYTPEVA